MVQQIEVPQILTQIPDPPGKLFAIGNVELLNSSKIAAVVGSRKMSDRGKEATISIVKELVQDNFIIISGMALGIDSVAHWTAINNGGKTIAVLGAGIDIIYPPQNKDLYQKISTAGLIISEYGPGVSVTREKFPARNRIVSGLSQKVFIIEGEIRSGSLITARLALDQGKDVLAVPGSPGTDYLIDQGATCIITS